MALLQLLREHAKGWSEGDPIIEADLGISYWFWCEPCDIWHRFQTKAARGREGQPVWAFNGNLDRPSFSPSLLVHGVIRCHLILTDGALNYCGDSEHALAGKSVPLKPLPHELAGGA